MKPNKNTQRIEVLHRINETGEVDNFWAISNYILRLGAIIHDLRQEGYEFDSKFGTARGFSPRFAKNYYYILTKRPEIKHQDVTKI